MRHIKIPLLLVAAALVSGCATKGYVTTQTDPLLERLGQLEQKMTALDARVPSLDSRVTILDSRVPALESRVTGLEGRLSALEPKVNNLENRPAPHATLSPEDQTAIREARDNARAALDKANSAEAAARENAKRSERMFNLQQKK